VGLGLGLLIFVFPSLLAVDIIIYAGMADAILKNPSIPLLGPRRPGSALFVVVPDLTSNY
jgi:hypothetical protein